MKTERQPYIEGLRILAAALEQHPEIPLPTQGDLLPLSIFFSDGDDPRALMAAAARALPCSWAKEVRDGETVSYFDLEGSLAGLKVQLSAQRDTVCTRRVVGIEDRAVEEVVTPAVTRKVTKPVEIVEWDCGPILRPEPALVPCPDTGSHFPHDRCPGVPAPPLPPGHGENHIDNAGHATLACAGSCEPGTCITCGATVDAAGVVTEASAS